MTSTLAEVRRLAAADSGLAVAVTIRPDGTPHASVVNAGVLAHPVEGDPVVGFVAAGGAVKLRNLRERRYASVVFRAGWEWVAVEGPAELAGRDDQRRAAVLVRPARISGNTSRR